MLREDRPRVGAVRVPLGDVTAGGVLHRPQQRAEHPLESPEHHQALSHRSADRPHVRGPRHHSAQVLAGGGDLRRRILQPHRENINIRKYITCFVGIA